MSDPHNNAAPPPDGPNGDDVPVPDEIINETYSPWLGKTWDEENLDNHNFVLPYDMNGGRQFEEIGSVPGVTSGTSACLDWAGRDPDASPFKPIPRRHDSSYGSQCLARLLSVWRH